MSLTVLRIWRFTVVLVVAGLVGWAIYRGNAWIPLPVIIAGGVILWLTRRKSPVEQVDERTFTVAHRAAFLVFRVFAVAAAAVGVTLLALDRADYPELSSAGMTLAYSCCALLLLYCLAYFYYNSKASGKE
jgi:uncharacterized membrane protein